MAKQNQPKAAPASVLVIELPANERGLPPDQIARFDRARAELLAPRSVLSDVQRDQRVRAMAAIENRLRQEAEKAWREQAVAETLALARGRGEEVQTRGAIRVNSHDGLRLLWERDPPKLTAEQYDAGCYFRRGWESRSQDVGSQMGAEQNGSAHNNDLFVFNRRLRAEKLAWLGKVERAVAIQLRAEPAALQMLRAVCGDGKSLIVFGRGRAFERHLNALRMALDIAHTIERPRSLAATNGQVP